MLAVIIIAILLAAAVYAILHAVMLNWISDVYNSQESRVERYGEYLDDLKDYVHDNGISSEDTAAITRWVRNKRNVYVFLYKDNQLFYDGTFGPGGDKDSTNGGEEPGTDVPDDDNGTEQIMSSGIFCLDKGQCIYWTGAGFQRYQKYCPNELMVWEAMQLLNQRGGGELNFGGMASYKLKFGTKYAYVPRIYIARYPFLINIKTI
jgi:hypothetical protein